MEDALLDTAVSQRHLERAPCANIKQMSGSMVNCHDKGKLTCSRCHLVQYCCRECQVAHWPTHKIDCNSDLRKKNWQPTWWRECRQPVFSSPIPCQSAFSPVPFLCFGGLKFLWGNVPLYDVLNLAKNEGQSYGQALALCFAGKSTLYALILATNGVKASGDIRNVIESVINLPEDYDKTCTCVLNDLDLAVVCRNIIMLLITLLLPGHQAVEIVLHVWYSARLTSDMAMSLQQTIKPLIAEVVGKIAHKPYSVLYSKTWTFGTSNLSARLYKEQWNFFLAMLEKDHNIDDTENSRRYIMLNDTRLDFRERNLFLLPLSRRVSTYKMRKDGILLPFGSCSEEFSFPNPTLFDHQTSSWMQKDSADPMAGWPLEKVLNSHAKYGTPDQDLYGLLYFYIRDKLSTFRDRTTTTTLQFHLYSADAAALPSLISRTLKFDRIEVANIVDNGYLGLERTLQACGPLLKPPSANPHAALITLFMNATEESARELGPHYTDQQSLSAVPRALKFIPRPTTFAINHPTILRISAAQTIFRDHEFLFRRYMETVDFDGVARRTEMKMREENRVVEAWPYRFVREVGEPGAQEAFDLLESSGLDGCERYVEWVRAE